MFHIIADKKRLRNTKGSPSAPINSKTIDDKTKQWTMFMDIRHETCHLACLVKLLWSPHKPTYDLVEVLR